MRKIQSHDKWGVADEDLKQLLDQTSVPLFESVGS